MARTSNTRTRWEEMDKSELPVRQAVEHYLTACRTEGKTPKTLEGYEEKLLRFVRWHEGTLGEFTLPRAREYVAALQAAPRWESHPSIQTSATCLSPGSVADHVRVLKGFATWLQEEQYLPENVLRRLSPPKVPRHVIEILNEEEVRRLLGAVDANSLHGARDLAILVLFLDTGLRLNELVGLRLDDVHLEEQWLKAMGKGRKERIVPFGMRATKVLLRYRSFFRSDDRACPAFFVNAAGEPITENSIKMLFGRLRERARIARLHPHLLRHTFATSYLLAGGDVFTLQSILGHTTLEMTRRYVTLASSHVSVQQHRFSPMDRMSGSPAGRQQSAARGPHANGSARREGVFQGGRDRLAARR